MYQTIYMYIYTVSFISSKALGVGLWFQLGHRLQFRVRLEKAHVCSMVFYPGLKYG